MIFPSSAPQPYKCENHGDSFVFTTDFNLTYEIYYLDGAAYLPDTAFGMHTKILGFKLITGPIKDIPSDLRIVSTILYNINQRFQDKETVIIYTCDQVDGREKVRKRLFDKWFVEHNTELLKVDLEFDNTLFITILYHPDNSNRAEIEQTIPDLKDKWGLA